MNIAVILASGQGKRMKAGKNKLMLSLKGRPIIYWTLKNFEQSSLIDKIILVCKKEEEEYFRSISKDASFKKVFDFVEGGNERQDSALNAVRFLSSVLSDDDKKESLLLFHNGANPFVEKEEIKEAIFWAKKEGASVVAHPSKDTLKEVDENNLVKKTLDRSKIWNMQTPQTIKFNLAFKAFESAKKDGYLGTDDVSLVERLGDKVKIVQASDFNFKITTQLDLELSNLVFDRYFE